MAKDKTRCLDCDKPLYEESSDDERQIAKQLCDSCWNKDDEEDEPELTAGGYEF